MDGGKKCQKDNREKIKNYHAEYNKKNKEKLKKQHKEYQKNNKEKIAKQRKKYREDNKDKIKEQKRTYRENNKDKIKESMAKHYQINKEENKLKRKDYFIKYREDNKKERKEKNKIYRKNNREEIRKRQIDFKKNNREKLLEQGRVRGKELRKNPIYRINKNMSGGISRSLKINKLSKNRRHWENIVGYTIKDLKEHLEKLFIVGMNWGNYGENGWHLDHILPVSFFKFNSMEDVEFKYCWSLHNLQPLWEKDNLKKLDKMILWSKKIEARNVEELIKNGELY